LRQSLRRKKVAVYFAISDEPPYGARCRERALSTTSIATIQGMNPNCRHTSSAEL
jgi:hypothetical protein